MFELDKYRNRFTGKGLRVLNQAIAESRDRGQNYVSLSHIFKALKTEEPWLFTQSLSFFKVEPPLTDDFLETLIADAPKHTGEGIQIAPETTWLFHQAIKCARARHSQRIDVIDLIAGLWEGLKADLPIWSVERSNRSVGISFKMMNREYFSFVPL